MTKKAIFLSLLGCFITILNIALGLSLLISVSMRPVENKGILVPKVFPRATPSVIVVS